MKYFWTKNTIDYFTELYSDNKKDYYKKIEQFVKYECTLEHNETHQDLMVDLIKQTSN